MKTLPPRSKKALEKVVDLLGDRLEPQFAVLIQRLERTLGDCLRAEGDPERQLEWSASRERLARNGAGFHSAFMSSIRQACAAA